MFCLRRGNVIQHMHIDRAFQLSAELKIKTTAGAAVRYNADLIYEWLKSKYLHVGLPDSILTDYYKKKNAGTAIETFYSAGEIFCCQLEELDKDFPGRMWTTEAEVIANDEKVLLGVKITYTTPAGKDFDRNILSVPRFVKDIAFAEEANDFRNGICDVRELGNKILRVDSPERLEELYNLITDPNRLFPVVVFTDSFDKSIESFKPVVEPGLLLKTDATIIAHVAYIPGDYWTIEWKKRVGNGWDVYGGAVRTYYKDVDFDNDSFEEKYRHPLFTAQRIIARGYADNDSEEKTVSDVFVDFLVEKIKNNDKRMRIDWKERGHKFLNAALREKEMLRSQAFDEKLARLKEEIANNQNDENFFNEMITGFESEIDALRKRNDDLEKETDRRVQEYADLADSYKEDADEAKKQNYGLKSRIESLKKQLAAAGKTEEIPFPPEDECTYGNLAAWVETYFQGKLVLTQRAIKALKDAGKSKETAYEDVPLVYKWVQFLGTEYRRNKMGELAIESVRDKAKAIGIENHDNLEEPPINKQQMGMLINKHEYDVLYKGNWRFMDFHLKKGVITDKRKCLRIYYFWDEEDEVVVIGHLPWHLETPGSN